MIIDILNHFLLKKGYSIVKYCAIENILSDIERLNIDNLKLKQENKDLKQQLNDLSGLSTKQKAINDYDFDNKELKTIYKSIENSYLAKDIKNNTNNKIAGVGFFINLSNEEGFKNE